jgi:hypothetical protein
LPFRLDIDYFAAAVLRAGFQALTTAEGGNALYRDLVIDPNSQSIIDCFKIITKRLQARDKRLRMAKSTKKRMVVKLVATADGNKKVRVATGNSGAKAKGKGKGKEADDVDINDLSGKET